MFMIAQKLVFAEVIARNKIPSYFPDTTVVPIVYLFLPNEKYSSMEPNTLQHVFVLYLIQ